MAAARRSGLLPWLRPDSKTQVTVEYKKDGGATIPLRVDTVVISTQHAESISTEELRKEILAKIIKPVIPANLLDERTIYHVSVISIFSPELFTYNCRSCCSKIQPSGRFVIGGPQGDAGLTGRKIIVDTYGGWGAHGGGAFSGKDFSKVDRSAAYTARWIGMRNLFGPLPHLLMLDRSQVPCCGRPCSSCPCSALVRYRCRRASVYLCRHLWYWEEDRRGARGDHPQQLRPPTRRYRYVIVCSEAAWRTNHASIIKFANLTFKGRSTYRLRHTATSVRFLSCQS